MSGLRIAHALAPGFLLTLVVHSGASLAQQRPEELPAIAVTANRGPQEIARTGSAITVIQSEEIERHGATVPSSMEELLALPGVGRKTANLVLSSCFGKPGIIVDTIVIDLPRPRRLAVRDSAEFAAYVHRIRHHFAELGIVKE